MVRGRHPAETVMEQESLIWLLGAAALVVQVLGFATAVHAVMSARTAQGAIAWSIALASVPILALPLYWVFGRNRFEGYVQARRGKVPDLAGLADSLRRGTAGSCTMEVGFGPEDTVYERLAAMPFTRGNDVTLLIDGPATFEAMFEAIAAARSYILVQFYTVVDDRLGMELQRRLIERAQAGVRVFLLYDEIGSIELSRGYLDTLRGAGVSVASFETTRWPTNRFQINFRNHRKILVVDGEVCFIGGHNVSDDYMGRNPRRGRWRDTHVRIAGPAAIEAQVVFAEDWYWATGTVPVLDWTAPPAAQADRAVLILPHGPSDEVESCGLFFTQAINSARHRLWIASPYFVPDARIVSALQLAAMRGVDVRIVLPARPDFFLVHLAAFAFIPQAEQVGIRFYRYQAGFMHHKVLLVDDRLAAVGTANLDNRSFRLNFEVTALVGDAGFAHEVEAMLERDFADCCLQTASDYEDRPAWFRVAVRIANLLSPIL
jgi:cardiolipin synthase A/B